MRRTMERQDGAAVVLIAIVLVALMAGVMLAVDVGGLLLRRREMVNGADSAAHAAAVTYLRNGGDVGIQAAVDGNFEANAPGAVDNSPGGYSCAYQYVGTHSLAEGTVRVTCTSNQPLYFAPVLGFGPHREVRTTADASWDATASSGNGTITLECGLSTSDPCGPGNKVPFCHNHGSSGYNMPNSSTSATGPHGHGGPNHQNGYDVIPPYWFQQNPNKPVVRYDGNNWPIITQMPPGFEALIGTSAEAFIAGGCAGPESHVWISN